MAVEFEGYSLYSGHSYEPVTSFTVAQIDGMIYPVGLDGKIDFPVGTKIGACKKPVKHGLNFCFFPKAHSGECNYFKVVHGGTYKFPDGVWGYYHPYWVKMKMFKQEPSISDLEAEIWDE